MYSSSQPRGLDGKWIAKNGVNAIHGKKPRSIKVKTVKKPKGRGSGFSGLRANTIPYARVNKRGATVGVNAGTIIPGTSKRVVFGGYGRIESFRGKTALDRAATKTLGALAPSGSRRHRGVALLRRNIKLNKPAHRVTLASASVGRGAQIRVGTSRKSGPTVVVRRGTHRVPVSKSKTGVKQYDRRMSTIAGRRTKVKKPRPQRRNKRK